jgi:NAD(P)H-dependent flavin oxidoreductase YrpB (nitropropane dioxygenase family)
MIVAWYTWYTEPVASGRNAVANGRNGHLEEPAADGVVVLAAALSSASRSPRARVSWVAEGIRALGLPFWVAGGAGWPGRLEEALRAGAAGTQVGTLFAYCDESGIAAELRRSVLESVARSGARVRTDGRASPTGFPFNVVAWDGDPAADVVRPRVCDLGYLRNPHRRGDGTIGYRCASEPDEQFVAKGGAPEETPGRKCLCNGLFSTVGLGQRREDGAVEPPLVTSGDDLVRLAEFLGGRTHYSAADAVRWLLGGTAT